MFVFSDIRVRMSGVDRLDLGVMEWVRGEGIPIHIYRERFIYTYVYICIDIYIYIYIHL
jgi:hypothetical protein